MNRLMANKPPTYDEQLDKIPLSIIEKYLRKKKLNNIGGINNEND